MLSFSSNGFLAASARFSIIVEILPVAVCADSSPAEAAEESTSAANFCRYASQLAVCIFTSLSAASGEIAATSLASGIRSIGPALSLFMLLSEKALGLARCNAISI